MIYFTTQGDTGAVLVLEPGNIERILRGHPLRTPDGNLLICYTPDMPWFEKEFKAMLTLHGGAIDAENFDNAIRLGMFRERVMR